ncbi:MAG: DNA repair protein RadC [Desulfofustis sp.]|jgi:DNA repair protein RadC|nr:DNA repair protein RadC [Desulfofustis sp.]
MDKKQWQDKGAGHRERLRRRFLDAGLDGFTDAEVLELLLSFGTPRKDCKEPAKALLKTFKTFAGVLDAEPARLQAIEGIGPKNSFALEFVKEAADRYLKQRLRSRRYLKSSSEVVDYLLYSMKGLVVEAFTVIYLDSSLAIIDTEVAAQGTVNVNSVYPREIVKKALAHNAAALVVAHNHPSGSLSPSPQDRQLTRSLYLACSLMQIRLLDHLIIGDGHYSFADNGLMADTASWCAAVCQPAQSVS